MAEKLLTAKKQKVVPNGKGRSSSALQGIALVGTYREGQLAWIKRSGVYNYPVKEGDEFDAATFGKIKELWLYAGTKGRRHCFSAEFVGKMTREEFLAAYPTYAKFGRGRSSGASHNAYYVFKTSFLDYGPKLEDPLVVARGVDFGGRSVKVKKAIEAFVNGGEFGSLADFLPSELSAVPRGLLRVCESAVQMDFVFLYRGRNEKPPALNAKTPPARNADLPLISLFSGAGGLDIGFDQAGFRTAVMVEFDPACCRTLRKNMPTTPVLEGDINQIPTKQILDAAGLKPLEAALVIGGPPCQSFSLAGKRMGLNDPRGKLVLEFIRVVREALPKGFVMENVRGLTNWEKGKALDAILNEAREPIVFGGKTYTYNVTYKILNAADYGTPQFRERVFIVGNRLEREYHFPKKEFGPPDNTEGLKPFATVRDAIGGLPPATPPSEVALRVSGTIKARIEKHGY